MGYQWRRIRGECVLWLVRASGAGYYMALELLIMSNEYQLQIDGKPKFYYTIIGRTEIQHYLDESAANPEARVQLVRITTDVLFGGYEYGLMDRHFKMLNNER